MIDPQTTWDSTFQTIPNVSTGIWTTNFSNWVKDRVHQKAMLTGITNPAPEFTYAFGVLKSQLDLATPQTTELAGITQFANAWEASILASTMTIIPGAFIGAATPPTTWSVVFTSIIDPASIALGKAKILTLQTAPKVADRNNSIFPTTFRDAFLLLTGSVTGLDSQPLPIPGPQPLNALNVPFI